MIPTYVEKPQSKSGGQRQKPKIGEYTIFWHSFYLLSLVPVLNPSHTAAKNCRPMSPCMMTEIHTEAILIA